ncbi:imipenem/basic amino acid-specific outer membrane pore [Pseudomonas sp. BIGb0408]|uniref:Imipenem/basic amino acid-specific outer membrane pore n=1 Tax=Phytopseudomonas flavescens TaxID=29435 RepID=A0A7Z0BT68_9GAMM|nr:MULTISPECIES: OprD family porin [Pseudomonas]MCW2294758.1 imipenem/basic amino acid-specific outer membrane pore [Pseudomonas sp. BIGb0408]NYH75968.1 imipenem/basic amino acid-specific outer membrane pore [Pseudomonas flavescens]
MKVQRTGLSLMALSASVLAISTAQASQAESKGFLEDSTLDLLTRNVYWHMDRHATGAQDNREWGQGFHLNYSSGYTQGTVGFGADLNAYMGIKLDSGRGRSGSGLLPVDSATSRADDEFGSLGGAVKMRLSNSELKYGQLRPYNPVIAVADARLVPATATGFQLTSAEIDGLIIDAGHFTSSRDFNQAGSRDGFYSTYAPGVEGGNVDYLGASWLASDALSFSAYASRYEDLWRQYYGNAIYNLPLSDEQALNVDFNIYRTLDEGKSVAGDIDVTAWSLATAYSVGAHTFTIAHQRVHGDQPFDYLTLGGGGAQDSIYLANSSQLVDFNGPGERSWRATYAMDLASYGVPGLSFYVSYIRGDNVDGSKMDASSPYGYYADNEKHWERDVNVQYVVQSGAAKDLKFRLRQATHRISGTSDVDSDQVRFIVEYPLSVL